MCFVKAKNLWETEGGDKGGYVSRHEDEDIDHEKSIIKQEFDSNLFIEIVYIRFG